MIFQNIFIILHYILNQNTFGFIGGMSELIIGVKESRFTGYFDQLSVKLRGLKRSIFLLYFIPTEKG